MTLTKRYAVAALTWGTLLAAAIAAQETAPPAPPQTPPAHNNVRRAIRWKHFDYTCEDGKKLTVYLGDTYAKISFGEQSYLLKQTVSADGNRYSDGKTVWWGKGNGGFLQEDTPDGNGKMIVKDCKLDQPLNAETGKVTGTVTYLQRMALPPNAVIEVKLQDVSLADAPAKVIAEQTYLMGQRQVPVPFALNFDSAKIDPKHTYSVSARITVDGKLRFTTDTSYPVLTAGKPAQIEIVVKPVAATSK
ncbi:MAG TPA: YbaY family lipoprotein [Candidatus Sulfotelmatobacter sp.]|nr:YbaY family lipoprotein [Candidatus Sulfotelmatobacter sp.]